MQPSRNHICYTYEVCRFGFNPSTPASPSQLDCLLIIVQCAFAVHFVRLSKLLSPFFLPKPSRHSRQKRHTDNDKSNCQWLVVLLLYIFCPSSVCVYMCGAEHLVLSAKKQLSACSTFRFAFATLSASFWLLPAAF